MKKRKGMFGKNNPAYKHGLAQKRPNNIFFTLRARCKNPNNISYSRYGAKGVKCQWNTFDEFWRDMSTSYLAHVNKYGEKNTQIDRINPIGDYSRENCRWVSLKEQARNTRNIPRFTSRGKTLTLAEWSEIVSIKPGTLWHRIVIARWPIEKALKTLIMKNQYR